MKTGSEQSCQRRPVTARSVRQGVGRQIVRSWRRYTRAEQVAARYNIQLKGEVKDASLRPRSSTRPSSHCPAAQRSHSCIRKRLPRPAVPIRDEVQISDVARLVEQAQQVARHPPGPGRRSGPKLAQGTYETPERLDGAISRLLDEIG